MDEKDLALYPFITEASAYVSGLGFSLERLIISRAMDAARSRGVERVLQALNGEIHKPALSVSDESKILIELLSYPFSRILVSCIDDNFLIRRYALAEAVSCYELLHSESSDFTCSIASDFHVDVISCDHEFDIHFTDYIRLASSMKALEWKLVNRKLQKGHVYISKEELARLLQEAIRDRIQSSLPLAVPVNICQMCAPYISPIQIELQQMKETFGSEDFGAVESSMFPPCMVHAISNVRAGVNLAHSMRFALTSFLRNVGMSVDDIVAMFNVSPDFDMEKTRYQIEHISGSSGTEYKPPSCSTMRTYGNCYGADELCSRIKHPLNYYSRKTWFKHRNADSQQFPLSEKDKE